jgi:nitrite reductase (NO-forming)
MKKTTVLFVIILFAMACGSNHNDKSSDGFNKEDAMLAGAGIYERVCYTCHQGEGKGLGGIYPPLAASDYLNEDVDRAIKGLIYGQKGEMIVNGIVYDGEMPPQDLTDEEIADVLTFVYNSWGNNETVVTPEMVAKHR